MRHVIAILVLALPATSACSDPGPALPPELVAEARTLAERALAGSGGYDFVRDLTVEVGPRLPGTDADRRAVEWARARLASMGFDRVWTEPVTVPVWRRGAERGEILSPYPQPVVLTALGGSIATGPPGAPAPIEAEVIGVPDLAALDALDPSAVAGKIVYVGGRMARQRDGSGYRAAVDKRGTGHSKAAGKGAVALLIRSAGTSSGRFAHTGSVRTDADVSVAEIPSAALSNVDADLLEAQLASGRPVRFRLSLEAGLAGEATSANVLAEIEGTDRRSEIVLLVAHLDSWDLGQGAVDDGVGCAIVAHAARLLRELPRRPRRTVRVLLTANEEHGLSGARAYLAAHEAEVERHVLGLEADFGAGRVWRLVSKVGAEALPLVAGLAGLLAPLGVEAGGNDGQGGADLSLLRKRGLPVLDLTQDGTAYFDVHHTANDTLAAIEPSAVDQNVAVYATAAWVAANAGEGFGRPMPEPTTE